MARKTTSQEQIKEIFCINWRKKTLFTAAVVVVVVNFMLKIGYNLDLELSGGRIRFPSFEFLYKQYEFVSLYRVKTGI